jgi:hypothetical protein
MNNNNNALFNNDIVMWIGMLRSTMKKFYSIYV